MGSFKEFLGLEKNKAWYEFSNQIGAQYIEGGLLKGKKVTAKVKGWTITLETYSSSSGDSTSTFTRLGALFITSDKLKFKIYPKGIFDEIGKLFKMQDITIGDDVFDDKYIIKGNDEKKVHQLFSNPTLRAMMQSDEYFNLEIITDRGAFTPYYGEGIYELCFQDRGVIDDIERLENLYNIFVEVLNQLHLMGSISDCEPFKD